MKATYFKRTICAALAGLMLALTACGDVSNGGSAGDVSVDADTDSIGDAGASASGAEDVTDPASGISVKPLSAVDLGTPHGEPDGAFYDAYRNYSAKLFAATCADDLAKGGNAMISPESVMMALGMTANGANGETLAQMESVLGDQGIDTLNDSMLHMADRAINAEDIKFNIANSLWVRDDEERIQMKQEFCDTVKSFYGADSFLAPFDQTTCDDINGWVDGKTNGMIPDILDEIPVDAVAYLVNAISFEGEWETAYEEYQVQEDDVFTNSSGEEERVNMLYSTEGVYVHDDDTEGFLKYYKGRFAFMALLPEEGVDLADYVSAMDGDKLTGLWNSRDLDCEVYAAIPEFTSDYGIELSDPLKAMGMELPFSGDADFSNMAVTGSGALYISRVLHKTHIELDRTGTKAAAATAVEMNDECAAVISEDFYTVYLNRPFVYAIVDSLTGAPVFMGAVNTVTDS